MIREVLFSVIHIIILLSLSAALGSVSRRLCPIDTRGRTRNIRVCNIFRARMREYMVRATKWVTYVDDASDADADA